MKMLGIDPGTHRIGWGIIQISGNNQAPLIHGCIEVPPKTENAKYLQIIYTKLAAIIATHKPDAAAIEKVFFHKNKKTATAVSQAKGVILLLLAQSCLPYLELSPSTIKLAVAGSGKATKTQVKHMVELLLGIDVSKELDDTIDALAVAITASSMKASL